MANPPLSVMTFNIGNGLVRPDRLVARLATPDINVIGLQEVSPDQADAILRGTEHTHPFRILSGAGFHGRGLLSRYPITDHEWIPASEARPDLVGQITIDGESVAVLVGHPMPPRLGRWGLVFDVSSRSQIERFAEVLNERTPGILLADMNMTVRNPLYRYLIEAGLIDAHTVAGSGAGRTFPVRPGQIRRFSHPFTGVPLPAVARIDFILHTDSITTESVQVGEAIGSDHKPVYAKLRLPGGESDSDRSSES